jgi:murein DD-endopeptidase MepM/ murein hydrolase activator NlpD
MAFHPLIVVPEGEPLEVFDFTRGYDPDRARSDYGVGRYDERRVGMYDAALFTAGKRARDVHMGIDIGAPAGTEVFAFDDGAIFLFGDNAAPGDYGPTLVTRHVLDGRDLYVLLGHLSRRTLDGKRTGQQFARGDVLGWVGTKEENGGWNPHVHVQLAWAAPERPDLPGVVADADRAAARERYPDPRLILGALY